MYYCEYCHEVVDENRYHRNTCDQCGADVEQVSGLLYKHPVLRKDEQGVIDNPFYIKFTEYMFLRFE